MSPWKLFSVKPEMCQCTKLEFLVHGSSFDRIPFLTHVGDGGITVGLLGESHICCLVAVAEYKWQVVKHTKSKIINIHFIAMWLKFGMRYLFHGN